MMSVLNGSVGERGRNLRNDVTTVAWLLNTNLALLGLLRKVPTDGTMDRSIVEAIRAYQTRALHMTAPTGRVEPNSRTERGLLQWSILSARLADEVRAGQKLQSETDGPMPSVYELAPGGGKNQHYTASAWEVTKVKTVPTLVELNNALGSAWPDLTLQGRHLLCAQFLVETGGKDCYNWNYGNVQSTADKPHVYLVGACDRVKIAYANTLIANGRARLATPGEIAKAKLTPGDGQTVVVWKPPSAGCRFRAFASMAEGAVGWADHYKKMTSNQFKLLVILNTGNTKEFAHVLKQYNYYSAAEAQYFPVLRDSKANVDRLLGAV